MSAAASQSSHASQEDIAEHSPTGGASRSRPGDPAARDLDFDTVYTEWFHEVARWVRAFGGLEADLEDLVQEVFLVVRKKLYAFDGRNLAGWLYRIAQRTVSDYRRRAWFKRFFQPRRQWLEAIVDTAPGPEVHAERRDAERLLAQVLSKLSPARRTAFILFEIEGYSGEEIAGLEGVPLKTVYTRLHYARKDFFRLVAELALNDHESSGKRGVADRRRDGGSA